MRRIMNISKGWVVLLLALPALDLRSAEVAPAAPDLVVFQKVDMNHDGKVSVQEARGRCRPQRRVRHSGRQS